MKKFKSIVAQPNFPEMENQILDWWYKTGIVKKYLEKNNQSKKKLLFYGWANYR